MMNKPTFWVAIIFFALGMVANEYYREISGKNNELLPNQTSPADNISLSPPLADNQPEPNSIPAKTIPVTENIVEQQIPDSLFSWAQIKAFIDTGRYDEATAQLRDFLDNNSDSAQAWYLLAVSLEKQNQHEQSMHAWFQYLGKEIDAYNIDRALINVKNYLVRLYEQPSLISNNRTWLITQLDKLLHFRSNDAQLHLMLASLYLKSDNDYQAQYHALMAANDPTVQDEAEEILAQLNGTPVTDELTLPLIRFGKQYLINIDIEGNPAKLLLDTGASISGVSNTYAARYPGIVKAQKPIKLNTANGSVNSYLFTVDTLKFGDILFRQHILAILPLDSSAEFDGLLGIDLLGRFDFIIDQNAAVLRLKTREQ